VPEDQSEQEPEQPPDRERDESRGDERDDVDTGRPLEDVILEATRAAIPAGLLAALRGGTADRSRSQTAGRAGATRVAGRRGRPAGTRRGELRAGVRLNVVETLRAAAPWQPLRKRMQTSAAGAARRIEVRSDDFRVSRYKERSQTTSIFVVDASGSSALHRLAEAKGAVELLLADCYVRRDQVALVAFRGQAAELLLPPTRSLVRAKRGLAGLPGGGGTPLASALKLAFDLGIAIRRRGDTPVLILLTDGHANVALDGTHGRQRAAEDATTLARGIVQAGFTTLVIDTSPRPRPQAAKLAADLRAQYLPLPYADARTLSGAVRAATQSGPAVHAHAT
jgi:magnesium chelatase subunit D